MTGIADLSGIEGVILAVAYLVAQLAAFYAVYKKVERTAVKVDQIDNAVNGRPPGAVTVGQQVETAAAVLPLVVKIDKDTTEIKAHLKEQQ